MKTVLISILLALAPLVVQADELPLTAKNSGQPAERFIVRSQTEISDDAIRKTDCRSLQRLRFSASTVLFVECPAGSEKLLVESGVNSWITRKTTEYKPLDLKGSVALTLSAFINPENVKGDKMAYYFPAQGNTDRERQAWMLDMLKSQIARDTSLKVILIDKSGKLHGFKPSYVAAEKLWSPINTPYGVSIKADDLSSFLASNPAETGNELRIVGQ